MKILRLTPAFEVADADVPGLGRRHQVVGAVPTAAAALTRALDARGVVQRVLTSRPPGVPQRERIGRSGVVLRLGGGSRASRESFPAAAYRAGARVAGVDLVHLHHGEDVALLPVAAALSRRLDVPLVVTVHASLRNTVRPDGVRSTLLRAAGGAAERRVLPAADLVVALTPGAATALVEDGVPADRVFIVPTGIDRARFRSPAPDAEVRTLAGPTILTVGRLDRGADLVTLLRAMLALRTPGAHLVVVGDGPARTLARHLVGQLGLTGRVRLLGAVPHARVPRLLAAADVVALPRRYAESGAPALEAMAAGVPVVATDTGGMAAAILDGRTGDLVPAQDPLALAAALDRMLADPRRRARMHANGKARAAAYGQDGLAGRLLGAYAALTERPPPAARSPRQPALLD